MRSVKEAQTEILMIFDSRCSRDGLKSPVWIRGWKRTLHRAFVRAIDNDEPSAPTLNTAIGDIFGQVSRAIGRGNFGPAAFDLLLQVLSRKCDNGDAGSALSELHSFGVPNGSPCAAYYRAFRMVVSGVTGSERALAPGVALLLESVRLSVNKQFSRLMPSLYPGELATRPKPFDSIDAIWLALGTLANNKTPAIFGENNIVTTCGIGGTCFRSVGSPACCPRPRAGTRDIADFCLGDGFAMQPGRNECFTSFHRLLGLIHIVVAMDACAL